MTFFKKYDHKQDTSNKWILHIFSKNVTRINQKFVNFMFRNFLIILIFNYSFIIAYKTHSKSLVKNLDVIKKLFEILAIIISKTYMDCKVVQNYVVTPIKLG